MVFQNKVARRLGMALLASTVAATLAGGLWLSEALAAKADPARKVGLGRVLTSKDGGQIFGFDINQNGDDGILATASSVEIFDQDQGKIKKSLGHFVNSDSDYVAYGIAAGDVALVAHEVVPDGQLFPKRHYMVLNPVSGEKFTGDWTPPKRQMILQQMAEEQSAPFSTLFALTRLNQQEKPTLLVSNIASNTFSKIIDLDPDLFGPADGPILGQYTAGNQAVFALSPDGGAVHGVAPINVMFDLSTGEMTQMQGFNNGFYHAGSVNGLAVDPNTGIAATTTELNAEVEFYDLKMRSQIIAVQLPGTGATDQSCSGSNIAVDPVHKLFLVTEYFYCEGGQGSAIIVYDERGDFIETIPGFNFAIGEPAPVINPAKRMGWAFSGPNGFSQLQQFFY